MGILRSLALCAVSLILAASFTLSAAAFGASALLHPGVYLNAADKGGGYDMIDKQLSSGSIPLAGAFTREEMKAMLERLLAGLLAYVRSDTAELNLTLEIKPDKIKAAFVAYAEKLPQCPAGQDTFAAMSCKPANMPAEQLVDAAFASGSVALPQSIDLKDVLFKDDSLQKIREMAGIFKTVQIVLLIIAAACIAAVALLLRSPKNIAKWLGAAAIISGGIVLLAANPVRSAAAQYAPTGEFAAFAGEIISSVTGQMQLAGAAVFAIGIALIAFYFLKKNGKKL